MNLYTKSVQNSVEKPTLNILLQPLFYREFKEQKSDGILLLTTLITHHKIKIKPEFFLFKSGEF